MYTIVPGMEQLYVKPAQLLTTIIVPVYDRNTIVIVLIVVAAAVDEKKNYRATIRYHSYLNNTISIINIYIISNKK